MSKEFCRIEYKKSDVSTKNLKKFFKKLSSHYVSVGVHRAEGQEVVNVSDGKPFTMIENACIQEFGNTQKVEKTRRFKSPFTGKWFYIKAGTIINIPPRVFVRIFTKSKKLQKELTKAFRDIIQNAKYNDPESVYEQLGNFAQIRMKQRVWFKEVKPKNANMTIEYKGFNHPLFMTGKLANAIKSEVH